MEKSFGEYVPVLAGSRKAWLLKLKGKVYTSFVRRSCFICGTDYGSETWPMHHEVKLDRNEYAHCSEGCVVLNCKKDRKIPRFENYYFFY